MSAILINAKALKEQEIVSLREEVEIIKEETGRTPKLVIVKATDNKACEAYIRNKVKFCKNVGVESEVVEIPYGTSIEVFENILRDLKTDLYVDGVIVQEPVYGYLYDKNMILNLLSGSKDADCFKAINLGEMVQHGGKGIIPCTPAGVIDILKYHKVKISGKRVTVVGRSTHVGLSLSILLTQMGAVVTTTHSKTPSLEEDIRNADIVISCVGKENLIQPEWMKKGSVILGVGITFRDGKQYTDYDVDRMLIESKCSLVGDRVNCTGTATVINLIKNTIKLCKESEIVYV